MATHNNPCPLGRDKNSIIKISAYFLLITSILLSSLNAFSQAPVITSSTVGSGISGATFTYTIAASNTPTSFSTSTLPSGLTINTSTGVISGTPATAGNYIDTIKAINGSGTGSQILNIVIISAWSLTGNSGTNPSTNFLGTTDNQDVVFKRNGIKSGLIDSSLANTALGYSALKVDTSTGANNTAIGYNSLFLNTSGGENTAIGVRSLWYDNANNNTALGYEALELNTASNNTAVGMNSSQYNSTGYENTSVGVSSLISNTAGAENTAIGFSSLSNNRTNYNTAVGFSSLSTDSIGAYNTSIGANADVASNNVSYAISLGYKANATSNQFALSDSVHTIKAKGLPTGAGYVLTDVSGNGNLSLQPIAGGTTAWSLSGNTPIPGSSYIGSSSNVSLRFRTHNIERMTIDSIGRVGIGTTNIADTSYNLYVEKGISTRKVKVNIASWSDFVFDADYKLSSLTDVENYIKQNKHLPDVPSTNEVEKNGIDLGTNQKILLQKIEELTLYIIDQNKKIEELQNQNDQLQQLKKEVDDLKMLLQKNK